ncbi:MAG: hypothetical protein O8C67_16470 [Candidatus Methanoperedens sp.]|nr:hypothetical protein [Candidatus Methanoperedens sp.]
MDADERRFIARAYIALVRLFLPAAPCKNQGTSPQSAQSPQSSGCGLRWCSWRGVEGVEAGRRRPD